MPIVFVHGVNTRREESGYEARLLLVEKFLRKHFTGATINGKVLATVKPRFPYWGDLATRFAWNMASLPSGRIDSLGAPGVEDDLRPLVAIIRDGLSDPKSAQNSRPREIRERQGKAYESQITSHQGQTLWACQLLLVTCCWVIRDTFRGSKHSRWLDQETIPQVIALLKRIPSLESSVLCTLVPCYSLVATHLSYKRYDNPYL
jgi:hypothetical protein